MPNLNGDMSQRVSVNIDLQPWLHSPSGSVWRKRLHLVGAAESGQVTSIVRYDANAQFHPHPHPDGEEILVLSGVFSDQQGDWPAGSYLLNPEGFEHAPFSQPGCVLFVKLRQYRGTARKHQALDTNALAWKPTDLPDIESKLLYAEAGYPEQMHLERWKAGTQLESRAYPDGAEILVIDGELADEQGEYPALSWLRLPPGASHTPQSHRGCQLYIKTGGLF